MLCIIHVSIQMLYVGERGTRGMGERGGRFEKTCCLR